MTNTPNKPQIGLALSGAAAQGVFYIGFLEVMHEQGIKFDYIAACSSSTVVAAAYACGTLEELKDYVLSSLNRQLLFSFLDRSSDKGGFYNLDRIEELLRTFTLNKNFEDVKPLMGFVTVDLEQGEQVILSMGDIARAARISCTLPALFNPVRWGNRMLIDGGILSIVPGDVVRGAGMDVVVGINLRGQPHIFSPLQKVMIRVVNALRKVFLINRADHLWQQLMSGVKNTDFFNYYPGLDALQKSGVRGGLFGVLGRSLDLAIAAKERDKEVAARNYDCDLLISERPVELGRADMSASKEIYKRGREIGVQYAPMIKDLIARAEIKNVPEPVKELV